jgi:hypothetical protein
MNINWVDFVDQMLDVVSELSDLRQDLTGKEKLERLTNEVAEALEKVDDLVSFLPPGVATLAKFLIDSDQINQWQRDALAKPIAEMLYQMWVRVVDVLDDN